MSSDCGSEGRGFESRRSPFYILRRYAEYALRGTRGYLPAAWQRRGSTRPAGIGQRPYEAEGVREEMPGGTLRGEFEAESRRRLNARVPLYGCKVWRRGLRRSVYVVPECNGFASEPTRSCSRHRGAGRRTRNRRERHACGFVVSAFASDGGEPLGPAGHLRSTKRAKRCTCVDATNFHSTEHADDQCREVPIHGVLRSPRSSHTSVGPSLLTEARSRRILSEHSMSIHSTCV